jgi:hypothetical protein
MILNRARYVLTSSILRTRYYNRTKGIPVAVPSQKDKETKTETTEETSTAVVVKTPNYRNSDLQSIRTFEDTIALMREEYGDGGVLTVDEVIGNGFGLLQNKDHLVGVPFALLKWQFYPGKFQDQFVTVMVVTQDGKKYLVNDGSTGLCKQLWEVTATTGRSGGVVARKGLTRSDYKWIDEADGGKEKDAHTFYLDTSAL